MRKLLAKSQADQVVIEICPLAAMVYDIGRELGMSVLVADPTQDAWRWRNVKRKTDRDDALKLARLAAIGQINPVHIPEASMRQWRALLELRNTLVQTYVASKNRIRQMLRKMLAQAAWAAVRYSVHFREIFLRVSHGSRGRRKIAIVEGVRRLLVTAWARLRDETPYRAAGRQQAA